MIVMTRPRTDNANGKAEWRLASAWMNSIEAILSTKASCECMEGIPVPEDGVADSAK